MEELYKAAKTVIRLLSSTADDPDEVHSEIPLSLEVTC